MVNNKIVHTLLCMLLSLTVSAQDTYWWGAAVGLGHEQPFTNLPLFDFNKQDANNQIAPLFLSSDGEYIWSDKPFNFTFKNGSIRPSTILVPVKAGSTLRDAYMTAQAKFFPPSGLLPDTIFFTRPQYNTWIELMYNQNQADILSYAHAVIDNGFPAGVLMIDDNWQHHYGSFQFKKEQFPNPKAMVDELHELGFKVMLWVCPFVSADSPEFRELAYKGYLLPSADDGIAIFNWWNGYSACYDMTNPEAVEYFVGLLRRMQAEYGIDGFKFDAGDNNCYASARYVPYSRYSTNVDHTAAWAKIGLQFPFNEYRACWKMGGQPLVQRLGDKDYSWEAVQQLIPQMCVAGLLGYAYTCPDMIGGGQFTSFLNVDSTNCDPALIVRSAQVHAMMPMMQFSVAPWRILSRENLDIVRHTAEMHMALGPYIMEYARKAAETGEPIVRLMEYQFPNQGLAEVKDQFMLGDRYLVAPVVDNTLERDVRLPIGTWRDDEGKTYKGGKTYHIIVPLDRLPFFELIK